MDQPNTSPPKIVLPTKWLRELCTGEKFHRHSETGKSGCDTQAEADVGIALHELYALRTSLENGVFRELLSEAALLRCDQCDRTMLEKPKNKPCPACRGVRAFLRNAFQP